VTSTEGSGKIRENLDVESGLARIAVFSVPKKLIDERHTNQDSKVDLERKKLPENI